MYTQKDDEYGETLMAGKVTDEYDAVFQAARRLPPAEQLRLARELVSGDHLVAFWEEWQRRLAEQGDVASEAEVDASVAQVRVKRHRGKR
jgi:hypothetical protein